MKKGIILLAVAFAVAIAILFYSSSYKEKKYQELETAVKYSTTTEKPKKLEEMVIAECKEADYRVKVYDKKIWVEHGEYTKDLSSAYRFFQTEAPEFYYLDCDGDGKKEVFMRYLSFKSKSDVAHDIMCLIPTITETGEKTFIIRQAASGLWKTTFEKYITCEFTQLKSNKKILQFAMNNKGEKINYDEKTGITDNKYSGFACMSKSKEGEYYTLSKWSKGVGSYSFDKNGKLILEIQVLIEYKETSMTECVGTIRSTISYDKDTGFEITPNTIVFIPDKGKCAADPRKASNEKWSVELKNLSEAPATENFKVDWVDNTFEVDSLGETQEQYFSELSSKVKCLDSIVFTQDSIVLTTKEKYTFDNNIVNEQKINVTARLNGKKEYNIGNLCTVTKSGNREVMTIALDQSFSKAEMQDVRIAFGA